MGDDSSNRTSVSDRDAGLSRDLHGGSDPVPLQRATPGIPSTRKGQHALSQYARATALEVLRESTRPGAPHPERDAEAGPANPGQFLFDAFDEEEPDTSVSRVIAPLQSAQLAREHKQVSMAPPAPDLDDREGNHDERSEREND